MAKWSSRLLGLAFALALVVAVVVLLLARASLPELDGSVVVAGLDAPATLERDEQGVPVITASSRADLAFATGFAHGQDRFFQMDLIRRQAAGELSELFGAAAIDADRRYRFHRFRTRAREALAAMSVADRQLLDRYAAGVNAGLDSLGARPFEYLVIQQEPRPWAAEDTALVVQAMYLQLNDERARRDVQRGLAYRVLDPEVYAWLYPAGTRWDAPLAGGAIEVPPVPPAEQYSIREYNIETVAGTERESSLLPGSNNWAVSGKLTATGRAMVANDMHLGLSVPNIYYRARLVQTGPQARDLTGVTLPGTPFVVAGSNTHVAWGYTNSYGDWSDAVIVEPGGSPGTYRTPDGDQPFTVFAETIRVADSEPVEFEVRETVWGPIDDSIAYPDGDVAVIWLGHYPSAVNLRLLDLETARSVEEALDIANRMGIPPQNFVTGDADGNIGWTIAGRIPVKSSYRADVPVLLGPEEGWIGWREPGEYPRIYNPESGRIWTANARVVNGRALEIIGDGGYDLAARARQIRDALLAKDRFSATDMLAIQYDDRALFLDTWRKLLLGVLTDEAVAGEPGMQEYRDIVANWIPRAAPESAGYRLVRAFRLDVMDKVFRAVTAPVAAAYDEPVELLVGQQFEGPLWQLVTERPAHMLPADYASWDALLLDAVRSTIEHFRESYDGGLAERTWGEYNTARIRHPLSRALPALSGWLDMPPDPMNGDSNLPKAQGPEFGASERFAVSPGAEEAGIMHMPTGQSGHPLSPFYTSGHESWLRGEAQRFLPGEPVHTLTLTPEGK